MNSLMNIQFALLTKSSGKIVGPISDVLALIMNSIFNAASNLFEIGSLGVSIILFTIIVKALMMPLMINQQKSMKRMQSVQPEIQKIQNKYKNKKDPESQQKMQQELSKFYKDNKVNPLGGCFPLLIQMPIFFALFNVLRNIPAYILKVGDQFRLIATEIMSVDGYSEILNSLHNSKILPKFDPSNTESVMDLLAKLTNVQWDTLVSSIPANISTTIEPAITNIHNMNFFFGVNLAENPGLAFPGIFIIILAGVTTYFSSKLMSSMNGKKGEQNEKAMQTQKTMNTMMPFMTAFFAYTMPAGLGIYWITSNLFQMAQQVIVNKIMEKEDEKKDIIDVKAKKVISNKGGKK